MTEVSTPTGEEPTSEQSVVYHELGQPQMGAQIEAERNEVEGREVSLDQLADTSLRVGDIITDINGARAFDQLEQILARKANHGNQADANSVTRIKPLSSQLRPPKFLGEIGDGSAVVIPFSDAAIGHLDSVGFHNPDTLRATHLSYIITTNLRSTGRGTVGSVSREVSYWPRMSSHSVAGNVVRHLGPILRGSSTAELGKKLLEETTAKHSEAVRWALRRAYSGGLPGHKRST